MLKIDSDASPDIRITATPAFPIPLASAYIVPGFIAKSKRHW
jgi:hypothetical protein